jgi:hypothetical protein|tara:strand:- start:322 stop:585 length:264 start_codon:yes stop_codon:yes gene_type:complete
MVRKSISSVKINLDMVNNVLLVVAIVLLLGLLVKRVQERFQDVCNASATGVSNVMECSGDNQGEVITDPNGNKYQCGATDGYAFACL